LTGIALAATPHHGVPLAAELDYAGQHREVIAGTGHLLEGAAGVTHAQESVGLECEGSALGRAREPERDSAGVVQPERDLR